jgi:hypothetical protein
MTHSPEPIFSRRIHARHYQSPKPHMGSRLASRRELITSWSSARGRDRSRWCRRPRGEATLQFPAVQGAQGRGRPEPSGSSSDMAATSTHGARRIRRGWNSREPPPGRPPISRGYARPLTREPRGGERWPCRRGLFARPHDWRAPVRRRPHDRHSWRRAGTGGRGRRGRRAPRPVLPCHVLFGRPFWRADGRPRMELVRLCQAKNVTPHHRCD